jgi:hypothetical protein
MTPDKITELRRLEQAATPGPWESYSASCCPDMGGVSGPPGTVCQSTLGRFGHPMDLTDAELIAAMRNALPGLLDRLEWAERAALEFDEFAISIGFGERPEGQGGVHRISGPELEQRWKAKEREIDALRDDAEGWLATQDELRAARDDAEIAADALRAENERLTKERDGWRALADQNAAMAHAEILRLEKERDALRAEMAVLAEMWREFRRTPPQDEHGSSAAWSRAYMTVERALDALAGRDGGK